MAWWKTLYSDPDAHWDKVVTIRGEDIAPVVTWGTSPEDVLPITGIVPAPEDFKGGKVDAARRSLDYMGLKPGMRLEDIEIDTVFIGSCTNGRIEDLRAAAAILKGKKIKDGLRAMVVPGSGLVRAQAEEEGLADIFKDAGFEWRLAGCSMCLAMNPDQLSPGERCAATSNRNFEGRQGRGGRTHLMSPAMAAAAAVTGPSDGRARVYVKLQHLRISGGTSAGSLPFTPIRLESNPHRHYPPTRVRQECGKEVARTGIVRQPHEYCPGAPRFCGILGQELSVNDALPAYAVLSSGLGTVFRVPRSA
jgi:hypothetical protein